MRSLLSLAAVAAAFTAAPSLAEDRPPPGATILVPTADLDLGTRAGIAALDRRIRDALETACGQVSDSDLAGKNRVRACLVATRAEVDAQRQRHLAAAARNRTPVLAASH
jgi:UrcA family protein